MRTSNPALKPSVFEQTIPEMDRAETMTLEGTINRSMLLLVLALVPAYFTWGMTFENPQQAMMFVWGGLIVGLIFKLITIFKANWAPVTAPIYAIAEGFFLGGISSFFNQQYPGIVIQAVGITFGILFSMLVVYRSGLIRVTEKFKAGVIAATGGIFLVYLASWILGFFGMGIPFIHESGWIGIGFSLFVIVIASLNFILDFDFIAEGTRRGAPKHMEWYGAFGLMVTLVWLYIEVLVLLSKLRR